MPNIKSAKKRVKVTRARTLKNKMLRSELKTAIKKYYAATAAGDKAAAEAVCCAVKKVDQASAAASYTKTRRAKEEPVSKTLTLLDKTQT